jgi:hypothetical protein
MSCKRVFYRFCLKRHKRNCLTLFCIYVKQHYQTWIRKHNSMKQKMIQQTQTDTPRTFNNQPNQSSSMWINRWAWKYVSLMTVLSRERIGSLSLVSTIEELLGRNNSDSGLETKNTAVGNHCADHATPPIRKSWHQLRRQAVGRSVCIVRSRTQGTKFFFLFLVSDSIMNCAMRAGNINSQSLVCSHPDYVHRSVLRNQPGA